MQQQDESGVIGTFFRDDRRLGGPALARGGGAGRCSAAGAGTRWTGEGEDGRGGDEGAGVRGAAGFDGDGEGGFEG